MPELISREGSKEKTVGRGSSAASASFLAAKAELLGELDAMLQEEWAVAHPAEVAERQRFFAGLLGKAK